MQTIIFLNILVIFISYFARYKHVKYALELAFLIIYLFTALRYNYGTDYSHYHEIFNDIAAYRNIFSINQANFAVEYGWMIVCYVF